MWQWLGLVLCSAGLAVVHFALVMRTARMLALTPAQRLLSVLVPPLTPFFAFRVGVRRRSVLWGVLLVVYVLLWNTHD